MAQPASFGLSNPYGERAPDVRPSRPRPALARAAVLAGVTGATAVGLGAGSGAWADPGTAMPVARYVPGSVYCLLNRPLPHQPVLDRTTAADGVQVSYRSGRVITRPEPLEGRAPRSQAWPLSCGSPPWSKPLPTDPAPRKPDPAPVDPAPVDPAPGDPVDSTQVVSLDGTVETGVEPGCVVLSDSNGRQWTLTGPLSTLPHGVPLTITGTTTRGLFTTCQQGEPVRVTRAELRSGTSTRRRPVPIATTDRLAAEATPVVVPQVAPTVQPACGPVGNGKIPSVALCTR